MKIKNKFTGLLLCLALGAASLTGCGGEKAAEPVKNEASKDAGKEDKKADTKEEKSEKKSDKSALKEDNQIPEDGVITKEQMESIAGEKGENRFHGETSDGIKYTWIYDGSKIKNPIEQKLKVEFSEENLDEIKKAADDAPYAMQVKLQEMELAAPATLEVTLTEKWDADRVLYCIYEDETLYQLDDAKIENAKESEESEENEVSKISFQVNKADGDVYVLLGGSTEGTDEEEQTASDEMQSGDESYDGENSETNAGSEAQEGGRNAENNAGSSSEEESHICTISIECSSILDNWDDLKSSKAEFVPSDGWILYPSEISFTPGDTVFDVLKDACGQAGIQMSSRYTPLYGSYYIEGINQLYEFDCGQNSGWMYSVNGWFPNYGCSEYKVEDGDNIEWKYTCNLGSDVGNGYAG